MAYPSVTNTLTNGQANDATAVNTNFTDIINGLSDGTKDFNMNDGALGGTLDVTGNVTMGGTVNVTGAITADYLSPHKGAPTTSMVWKDAATITVKAGRYWIGDKLVTLAADSDWSWTMDGVEAEAVSTWYYLYAYNLAGVVTPFASATAPTALYDTGMVTAAYDTNVYLGAFYNDSGGDIKYFIQHGGDFFIDSIEALSHTGDVNYTAKTMKMPSTTNIVYVKIYTNTTDKEGTCSGINSQNYLYMVTVGNAFGNGWVSVPTNGTVYLRVNAAAATVYVEMMGWKDKWL